MSTSASTPYQRHRLSVVDYHRMGQNGIFKADDRVELIEGEIIDTAPIGSCHAGTVNYLSKLIMVAVGDRAIVTVQNPILLGAHSEPQPDIALLKPREDFYRSSHPAPSDVLLLIEVADATLRYNREVKAPPPYARHGVPEFWIVDLNQRCLQLFSQPTETGYTKELTIEHPNERTLSGLTDLRIDLSGLFHPR